MSFTYKYLDFAESLYSALIDDSFYKTMEKSITVGDQREGMLKYFDYSMIEAEIFGRFHSPEGHRYGVSVWSKPIPKELEERRGMLKKNHLLKNILAKRASKFIVI